MMELNESLKRIIDKYPNLETATRGLPDLGNGYNNEGFSYETNKIYNLFKVYGNELYQLLDDEMKDIPTKSLGGGSPMKTKPLPLGQKKLLEQLTEVKFSVYPGGAG
ncbi:MAG: hypothetical protein RR404_03315, partial [Bacilli bacterium]